jgi:hypothetical protein
VLLVAIRSVIRACLVIAILTMPACGSETTRRQQEDLRAELATFPGPDHLKLVHQEERGISSCIGGDCPSAVRYYMSERSVEITCQDVTEAIDRWGIQQVEWRADEGEPDQCTAYGSDGDRHLSVAVFAAEELPPSVVSTIDVSQFRRARSAVLLDLGIGS